MRRARRAGAALLVLAAALAALGPAWAAGHRVGPATALRYDSEQVHLAEQIYAGLHQERFGDAAALRRLLVVRLAPGTRVRLYTGGPGQLCYSVHAGGHRRTYLSSYGALAQVRASCPAAGARGSRWRDGGTLAAPPVAGHGPPASTLPG